MTVASIDRAVRHELEKMWKEAAMDCFFKNPGIACRD
jgi:hypothetical protein